MTTLVSHTVEKTNATILDLEHLVHQSLGGGTNVKEATSRLLDQVITSIDLGSFCGRENELIAACTIPSQSDKKKDRRSQRKGKKPTGSIDYFSKVYLYLPTYPLLQLAAKYSRRVYDKPSGRERHSYVDSDWLQGTKAMVVKSLPIDDMNTIVFAIRGTQSFLDWAVNVRAAPTSPTGFLDDPSNYCHSGFLSVARKMVAPVAARLRSLLEEDPTRMSYSLVFTGHSAGGAVASLLYLHLLSESPVVQSELIHLRGCFKHIHCVTFGAPPLSLRPLQPSPTARGSKSMFFAFINEGDPVSRADKSYFLSLLDLYVSPAPGSLLALHDRKKKSAPIYWRTPSSDLSLAGRLVLLRPEDQPSGRPVFVAPPVPGGPPALPPRENVDACGITDTELRGVVFGDPVMHFMDLYSRRIDALARGALSRRS
ncbi:Lipase class 3 [Penicillium expansum]|nr:Lipase class 3 [Penicillium expansum]